jgi:hypothetical protein
MLCVASYDGALNDCLLLLLLQDDRDRAAEAGPKLDLAAPAAGPGSKGGVLLSVPLCRHIISQIISQSSMTGDGSRMVLHNDGWRNPNALPPGACSFCIGYTVSFRRPFVVNMVKTLTH